MAREARTFEKPYVLVLEGADDFGFLLGFLAALNIQNVQLTTIEGFPNLRPRLNVFTKTPGWSDVQRLGVLVDSDGDPVGRNQAVRDAIQSIGLQAGEPLALSGSQPAVIYSLLPGSDRVGCLEDLIAESLANSDKAGCIEAFLQCAGVHQQDPWSSRRCKSWVHSYVATTHGPGNKIGEATKAGAFDLQAPALAPVRDFLSRLTAA